MFVECPFSNTVWFWILQWCGLQNIQFDSVKDCLEYAAKWGNCPRKNQLMSMVLYALWNIWLARNDKSFKKIGVSPNKIADCIITQTFDWWKFRGKWCDSWAERRLFSFSNLVFVFFIHLYLFLCFYFVVLTNLATC